MKLSGRVLICLLGMFVAASLASCGSQSTRTDAKVVRLRPLSKPLAARAPSLAGASVTFANPRTGVVVARDRFTARVLVAGLQSKRLTEPHALGDDLLEFSLDGGRYDQPQFSGVDGRRAEALGVNGYYSVAKTPSITYRDVPAGQMVLSVRVVSAKGIPLGPHASVRFSVR